MPDQIKILKDSSGEKRLEIALRLSEAARKKALAEIKRQYPGVKKENLSKLYFGWIAHEKYIASFPPGLTKTLAEARKGKYY